MTTLTQQQIDGRTYTDRNGTTVRMDLCNYDPEIGDAIADAQTFEIAAETLAGILSPFRSSVGKRRTDPADIARVVAANAESTLVDFVAGMVVLPDQSETAQQSAVAMARSNNENERDINRGIQRMKSEILDYRMPDRRFVAWCWLRLHRAEIENAARNLV